MTLVELLPDGGGMLSIVKSTLGISDTKEVTLTFKPSVLNWLHMYSGLGFVLEFGEDLCVPVEVCARTVQRFGAWLAVELPEGT